jgi:hypothetical protein
LFIDYNFQFYTMSREINLLFICLEQLRKMLEETNEKAREASALAAEIGGEFEQELSTDLGSLKVQIEKLLENLDDVIEEGKTLRDDEESMETSLRTGLDDEENYKTDSEHMQDELRQEREEKKQKE